MKIYSSLLICFLPLGANAATLAVDDDCSLDVVFVMNTDQVTGGEIYNNKILATQQIASTLMDRFGETGIKMGAVFYNDQTFSTRTIDLADSFVTFVSEVSNGANFLGSSPLARNGLIGALEIMQLSTRPIEERIVIYLSDGNSRAGSFPAFEANQLQQTVGQVFSVTAQPNVAQPANNIDALRQISSDGSVLILPSYQDLGQGSGPATITELITCQCAVNAVPEPSSASLLLFGLAAVLRRRKR